MSFYNSGLFLIGFILGILITTIVFLIIVFIVWAFILKDEKPRRKK